MYIYGLLSKIKSFINNSPITQPVVRWDPKPLCLLFEIQENGGS